jgi:hypothetical protein
VFLIKFILIITSIKKYMYLTCSRDIYHFYRLNLKKLLKFNLEENFIKEELEHFLFLFFLMVQNIFSQRLWLCLIKSFPYIYKVRIFSIKKKKVKSCMIL